MSGLRCIFMGPNGTQRGLPGQLAYFLYQAEFGRYKRNSGSWNRSEEIWLDHLQKGIALCALPVRKGIGRSQDTYMPSCTRVLNISLYFFPWSL